MTARKTAAAPVKRTRRKPAAKPAPPPVVDDPSPLQQYAEPPPVQRYAEADQEYKAHFAADREAQIAARNAAPLPPDYYEPEYDPARDDDYSRPRSSFGRVVEAAMIIGMFVVAMSVLAFVMTELYRSVRTPDAPVAPPLVVVNPSLAELIEPIRVKLASDRAKAAIVADAYTGLAAALRGKSGERITSSRIYEAASTAYLTDVDARGGVAVGKEIDTAIGGYLGMSRSDDPKDPGWNPIQFDASHRAKLIEVVAAIADTAEALR